MLITLNIISWVVFLGLTARYFLKGDTHRTVFNGLASLTVLILLLYQGGLWAIKGHLWLLDKHHEQCTVTEVNL